VSDIFQEVQEEYRREQMAKLWAKYRVPVIAGVSAIVLAVAGYQGWSYWHASRVEASSREFEKIAELVAAGAGNEKAAAERFAKLTESATVGYAMAAKFQAAALRAEMGDVKAAVKLYDEIVASTSDPLFRDYAQLRGAILIVETESLENIRKRIEPLTENASPWRVLALEMLAYASFRAGKRDEALKLYAEVQAIPNVPDGSARRAKEMTSLLNAGLKVSDLTAGRGQQPGSGPMLLQPMQPAPEAGSLLGPPAQPPTP
jgi:hypothetical protein